MKRLDVVKIEIAKMSESSGNEQVFVRMVRTDCEVKNYFNRPVLEYSCWQTKHLPIKECLERAWFDASTLAIFSGLNSMEEVDLSGFSEQEEVILKESLSEFI